jgi:hypothetical protein
MSKRDLGREKNVFGRCFSRSNEQILDQKRKCASVFVEARLSKRDLGREKKCLADVF